MVEKYPASALHAPERRPLLVGCITLAAGTALALRPGSATRVPGIVDQEQTVRLLGLSDLVLAPGLLSGGPAPGR